MKRVIENSIAGLCITAVVVACNVALFSLFPLLHRFFSERINMVAGLRRPPAVIMEYRKPEEKKETRREERIRDVANPDRARNVSPVEFKFTPDLSVEGTGGVAMEQDELAAVVFEEGETDEPAVPLYQPPILYPDRARDLEIEGTLEVIIIIDTQGKVGSTEVVRSPHVSITNAARKVIATWRFKPARNKGVPVRMRVRQVIEFALE
ncbi:MAG: energy transducer TonB [Chitinispirillaceae bacterium]|nr:energy transducer TonB [Chitinispirillaceae bacterium]